MPVQIGGNDGVGVQGAAGDPEPADRPFLVELPQQLADRCIRAPS